MDVKQITGNVPDYTAYYTVDELKASTRRLHQDYPELVEIKRVGTSRQGDPIDCITIGDGPLSAVLVGGGHANEPLGCMVIDYFSRLLCEDDRLRESLGYQWHFIKCMDPDGMRRNEGWLSKPFTIQTYSRHYFRPPVLQQPEFTFRYRYKRFDFDAPLPETRALMTVMRAARPDFLYSLHCGSYGGAFYSVSEPCDTLYQPLRENLQNFDLHVLPYELIAGDVGGNTELADGIYRHHSLDEQYDLLEAEGVANPEVHFPHGGTGFEIARGYNAFVLNAEVDYCQDGRVANARPTDTPLQTVIATWRTFWVDVLELIQKIESAFAEFRLEYNKVLLQQIDMTIPDLDDAPSGKGMATFSQLHQYTEAPQLRVLREIGQLLGMIDDELANGNSSELLKNAHVMLTQRFSEIWGHLEASLAYRVVPIRDLIGYQLGAGLLAAAYVKDDRL